MAPLKRQMVAMLDCVIRVSPWLRSHGPIEADSLNTVSHSPALSPWLRSHGPIEAGAGRFRSFRLLRVLVGDNYPSGLATIGIPVLFFLSGGERKEAVGRLEFPPSAVPAGGGRLGPLVTSNRSPVRPLHGLSMPSPRPLLTSEADEWPRSSWGRSQASNRLSSLAASLAWLAPNGSWEGSAPGSCYGAPSDRLPPPSSSDP